MPYDSTLPVENTPVDAAQMRDQFNGLNDLITGLSVQSDNLANQINDLPHFIDLDEQINAKAAGPCDTVDPVSLVVSNPPTQAQVLAIANKVNEMLARMKRT